MLCFTISVFGQKINKLILEKEVERIETVLSANDMEGRKTFTPGNDKAAAFIENEFKSIGLKTLNGAAGYLQKFTLVKPKTASLAVTLNNQPVDNGKVIIISSAAELKVNNGSGYEKRYIKSGSLSAAAGKLITENKNMLVIVDTSFARNFPRLSGFKNQFLKSDKNIVFVLSADDPGSYTIDLKQEIVEPVLTNVVGVISGKSRKDEFVIFSGHYDHLGVGKAVNGDSIYNGANDDAAGITAIIMLAKYFKKLKNNERTLIFAAFTAEEIGGYGSQYFSKQLQPEKVAAMFNIEMIGTESKWGRGSAYITGYEKTDMGKILEKNLEGSSFKFYPDPYTTQQLFYRSDNATLARLGVPAHTISTSKMDDEPNYHKPSDETGTLDLKNMTEIIKAIALSAKSIVSGKHTPSRVNTADLVR